MDEVIKEIKKISSAGVNASNGDIVEEIGSNIQNKEGVTASKAAEEIAETITTIIDVSKKKVNDIGIDDGFISFRKPPAKENVIEANVAVINIFKE